MPYLETGILIVFATLLGAIAFFYRKKTAGPARENEAVLLEETDRRIRIKKGKCANYLNNQKVIVTNHKIIIQSEKGESTENPIRLHFSGHMVDSQEDYVIFPSMIESLRPPGPGGLLIPVASEAGRSFMSVFIETEQPELYQEKLELSTI